MFLELKTLIWSQENTKVKTEYILFFTPYLYLFGSAKLSKTIGSRWAEAVGRFIRLGEGSKF